MLRYALSATRVVVTEKAVAALARVGLATEAMATGEAAEPGPERVLPVEADALDTNGAAGRGSGRMKGDGREVTKITSSGSKWSSPSLAASLTGGSTSKSSAAILEVGSLTAAGGLELLEILSNARIIPRA